jgi:hypothetical protein
MKPCEFRPPCFRFGTSSDFSGSVRVTSSRTFTELFRLPADVGLYILIPMANRLSAQNKSMW